MILINGVLPGSGNVNHQPKILHSHDSIPSRYTPINPSTPCRTSLDRISTGDLSSVLPPTATPSRGVFDPDSSHPRVHQRGRLIHSAKLALESVKVKPSTAPIKRSLEIRSCGRSRGSAASIESIVEDIFCLALPTASKHRTRSVSSSSALEYDFGRPVDNSLTGCKSGVIIPQSKASETLDLVERRIIVESRYYVSKNVGFTIRVHMLYVRQPVELHGGEPEYFQGVWSELLTRLLKLSLTKTPSATAGIKPSISRL